MSAADAFAPLRLALERAGLRYAVGGSWASTAFGEPRFTNDVDIVADFTPQNLDGFLDCLPTTFYVDPDEAKNAVLLDRPFNVIYMPMAFKFFLSGSGLSESAVPFVTPEDILLAKLHWFHAGGEVSDVQWRDIQGIVRGRGPTLDREYLDQGARKLALFTLLAKALSEA